MKRSEMRAQTRILLGETVGDGYTDAEINTALNTSCLTIARDVLCLQTYRDIGTVAYNDPGVTDPLASTNFGRYALPEDFLSMISVQILQDGTWYELKRMDYHDFQERARIVQGGRPQAYRMEFGAVELTNPKPGDLWLWPYPDQTYDTQGNYILRRVYYQKPTAMSDDEQISELPEPAHLGACYHAAMVLSRKWKDRVLINEMISLWTDEEKRIKAWVNVQDLTGPFQIKNVYGR